MVVVVVVVIVLCLNVCGNIEFFLIGVTFVIIIIIVIYVTDSCDFISEVSGHISQIFL